MYVSIANGGSFQSRFWDKELIGTIYFSLEKVDIITLVRADITLKRVAITIGRADNHPNQPDITLEKIDVILERVDIALERVDHSGNGWYHPKLG